MKTMLTLDDELLPRLEELQRRHGYSFEKTLRLVMEEGLRRLQRGEVPRRESPTGEYRTPTVSLGRPHVPSLDNIAEVLAIGEGS